MVGENIIETIVIEFRYLSYLLMVLSGQSGMCGLKFISLSFIED